MYRSAKSYDRYIGRWSRRLARHFVAFAAISESSAVLDVGSGTGSLTNAVAAATKASSVVGVEPIPGFVRHARRQVTDQRVYFTKGDARLLPFADDSFDTSLAQLVVHGVFPAEAAVREMRRVTRRGGVIAACEWDFRSGMEMFHRVWDNVVAVDPTAATRHARHTPYGGQGELLALWRHCGLQETQETSFLIPLTFADFADFWLPIRDAPSAAWEHVRTLPRRARRDFQRRLRATLLNGGEDGPITLNARAWAVRGVVP